MRVYRVKAIHPDGVATNGVRHGQGDEWEMESSLAKAHEAAGLVRLTSEERLPNGAHAWDSDQIKAQSATGPDPDVTGTVTAYRRQEKEVR
jgi:hypothetical protein